MKKENKIFVAPCVKLKDTMLDNNLEMKNEKGVTLIARVITIVVLVILASISTYTGIGNVKETRESIRKTELQLVQQAVMQKYTKYNLTGDDKLIQGTSYQDFTELNSLIAEIRELIGVTIELKDDNANNYYRLNKASLANLGITNTEDEYIVNYTTGEVLNKTRLVNTDSKEPLYIYSKTSE